MLITLIDNDDVKVEALVQTGPDDHRDRSRRITKTRFYVTHAQDPRRSVEPNSNADSPEFKAVIRAFTKLSGQVTRAAFATLADLRIIDNPEGFKMSWSWKAGCYCGCSCGMVGNQILHVGGQPVHIYVTTKK